MRTSNCRQRDDRFELYRRGAISSRTAGELLGMPRLDFIRYAQLGIPNIDMTDDEWEQKKAAVTAWLES
jgi:hypothetical protein